MLCVCVSWCLCGKQEGETQENSPSKSRKRRRGGGGRGGGGRGGGGGRAAPAKKRVTRKILQDSEENQSTTDEQPSSQVSITSLGLYIHIYQLHIHISREMEPVFFIYIKLFLS